jgi:acetylglutamate kinase
MESITNAAKAAILVEALPHIQKYNNKIVVIKYGGNAMTDDSLKQAVMEDIVLLTLIGVKVVLVHGGGPEINVMLDKIGKESKFIDGLRYTDKETAEIVQMVLAGKVNKDLVSLLQAHNGKAVGLCGIDAGMIIASQKDEKLGYVGKIEQVNTGVILNALNNGYIPVVSTVAAGVDGEIYNINADTAAAEIAAKLGAEDLILMTDIVGLLRNKDDPNSLISEVRVDEVPVLKQLGIVSGGMIPKIDCCARAIRRGVEKAFIIDGRERHSIIVEMLTDEGLGTMFKM